MCDRPSFLCHKQVRKRDIGRGVLYSSVIMEMFNLLEELVDLIQE